MEGGPSKSDPGRRPNGPDQLEGIRGQVPQQARGVQPAGSGCRLLPADLRIGLHLLFKGYRRQQEKV